MATAKQQKTVHIPFINKDWKKPSSWLVDATEVVLITPTIAMFILANFANVEKNRKIKMSDVKRYATDMINLVWFLQDTIEFDYYGQLANGYHRLLACVMSGVPVTFRFRYGAEPRGFVTYDTGNNRNGEATLRIAARDLGEEITDADAKILASSINWIVNYESGKGEHNPKFTNAFKNKFYLDRFSEKQGRNYGDRKEGIKLARAAKKSLEGIGDSVALGLFFLGSEVPNRRTKNREFWQGVAYGTNLSEGDPRLVFREKIVDLLATSRRAGGKMKRDTVFALGLRCMRAFFDDVKIYRLSTKKTADEKELGFTRLSAVDDVTYSNPDYKNPHVDEIILSPEGTEFVNNLLGLNAKE